MRWGSLIYQAGARAPRPQKTKRDWAECYPDLSALGSVPLFSGILPLDPKDAVYPKKMEKVTMRRTIALAATIAMITVAMPQEADAQMAQLEQSMDRMRKRLDPKIYDGKTLNVTTWAQLKSVNNFARQFFGHLNTATKAWNSMSKGKTKARLAKLKEAQAYIYGLKPHIQAKAKTIERPAAATKKTFKQAGFSEIMTGPNAAATTPVLVDFFGGSETQVQVWGSPGSSERPSKWSIRMMFAVQYAGFTEADVVTAQIYKGSRKLGKPTNCKPVVLTPWPIAMFECRSEFRDAKQMHTSDGAHTIKLSYKNLVMGKTFKNFGDIAFNVFKLWRGSLNKPAVMWRTNYDVHMGPTTIEEFNSNTGGRRSRSKFVKTFQGSALSAMDSKSSRLLVLRTWVKRKKYFRTQATCLYKGKPVGWGTTDNSNSLDFDVSGRKSKRSKTEDKYRWDQLKFSLQGLKIVGDDGFRGGWSKPPHWLDKNPGSYKCIIIGDGKVLKEVFFDVGADGHVVKAPCQDKLLTTFRSVKLVKAKSKQWGERKWTRSTAFGGVVQWKKSCP